MFGEHAVMSHESLSKSLSKVPEVTLLFWIIKIAATTLGETAGDALSMSLNLGYGISTAIFAVIFAVLLACKLKPKIQFIFYWATIIATTTLGTTIADFVDRTLGVGYAGGSLILLILLGLFVCLVFKLRHNFGKKYSIC